MGSIIIALRSVCTQEVEPDGLVFAPDSVTGERIIEGASCEGARGRLRRSLGTARVVIQVAISFGDIIVPFAMTADYPTILELPVPVGAGIQQRERHSVPLSFRPASGIACEEVELSMVYPESPPIHGNGKHGRPRSLFFYCFSSISPNSASPRIVFMILVSSEYFRSLILYKISTAGASEHASLK